MDVCLAIVKNDTMFLECLFPVFMEEKEKGFRECTFTLRTQEFGFDALDVGMFSPDDAQGFQELFVDVGFGCKGLGQFSDGGCGCVDDSRGYLVEPGMLHDLRNLRRTVKETRKDICRDRTVILWLTSTTSMRVNRSLAE